MTDWIENGESGSSVRAKLNASAASVLLTESIPLTGNQINHLFSAPQTIIAAPGSGQAIVVLSVEWYNHVISPFGGVGADAGNLVITYQDKTGLIVVGDGGTFESFTSSFLFAPVFTGADGNGPSSGPQSPPGGSISPHPYTAIENQPLILSNSVDDYIDYGSIASSSITAANSGADYVIGDTGVVTYYNSTPGIHATYVIDSVDGGGGVVTYHLTNGGAGYKTGTTGNTTSTGGSQAGVGTGFQIDVNSVTPSDGSGLIVVTYKIITFP